MMACMPFHFSQSNLHNITTTVNVFFSATSLYFSFALSTIVAVAAAATDSWLLLFSKKKRSIWQSHQHEAIHMQYAICNMYIVMQTSLLIHVIRHNDSIEFKIFLINKFCSAWTWIC